MTTRQLAGFSYASDTVDVLTPGAQTTIQDYPGRIGYWDVGVPPSGPFDTLSFRWGIACLRIPKAPPGWKSPWPALPCGSIAPVLRGPYRRGAESGTDHRRRRRGIPDAGPLFHPRRGRAQAQLRDRSGNARLPMRAARPGRAPLHGQPLHLPWGISADMRTHPPDRGRAPPPPRPGFRVGAPRLPGHPVQVPGWPSSALGLRIPLRPVLTRAWEIRRPLRPPRSPDFFTGADIDTFFATAWKIHYNSNRTGVRLIGPKPAWARNDGGEAGLHPSNIHDNAYAIGTDRLHRRHARHPRPGRPEPGRLRLPRHHRRRPSLEDGPA